MFFWFLEREYLDQLSTIEWGEFGWFSEKAEFSKKKYLGCVLRAYVENPFWAGFDFFKKPVLSQFTLIPGELGQWKVSNHSIIIFTFVPICMDTGFIGTLQSF